MNVADMTCEQVNMALATRRGETIAVVPLPTTYPPRHSMGVPVYELEVPDYCRDWRWAGKVLEWMVPYEPVLESFELACGIRWKLSWFKPQLGFQECAKPTEAIARAGLQMMIEEENNEV